MSSSVGQRLAGIFILMIFLKDHKFCVRDGAETISAKEGETHEVPEKYVSNFEDLEIAVREKDEVPVVIEEPAPVINPANGKPIVDPNKALEENKTENNPYGYKEGDVWTNESGTWTCTGFEENGTPTYEEVKDEDAMPKENEGDSIEADDLTRIHKIGEKAQEVLFEKEVYTFQDFKNLFGTEEGKQLLIDLHGVTEGNLQHMEHHINEILSEG